MKINAYGNFYKLREYEEKNVIDSLKRSNIKKWIVKYT